MKRSLLFLILNITILSFFFGCTKSPNLKDVLNEDSLSVVVTPYLPKQDVYFELIRAENGVTKKYFSPNENDEEIRNFLIEDSYLVSIVPPGTYYITAAKYESPKKRVHSQKRDINSSLGELLITEISKKSNTAESRYFADYNFVETNLHDTNIVGSISIKSGEVILIPNIKLDIFYNEKTCKNADSLNISALNKSWYCTLTALVFEIQTVSLEKFRADAMKSQNKDALILLNRVIPREYEYGSIFKDKYLKSTNDKNIKRYVIQDDWEK